MKPPDHPIPSGDRRVAALYQAALHQAGHEVFLASRWRSYEGKGLPERQAEIAVKGRAEAARLIRRWQGVGRPERPEAWFTYHLYHKAPDLLGPAVAEALGIPYLVAEPSRAPKRAQGPFAEPYRAAEAAIRTAAALICPTRLDMECLAPLVAPARLHHLPPFLDPEPFAAARDDREAHRARLAGKLPLDPARSWLLAVAMMRRGDKLDSYRQLAGALARIAERPWQLLIVGDGEARAEAEAAFASLGPRIVFAGARPATDLPAIYAASDLYVWPACNEAYGMALLEAQAAGLPVVAGRVRGVVEVVVDGATGLLSTPDDEADFAAKTALLLGAPAWRAEMGGKAAAFAATERSLEAAARRLDAILGAAVAEPRR